MEKCLFSRWEAVDLFVKILSKYLCVNRQAIEENLSDYIIKYRKAPESRAVAEQTLMLIADTRFGTENYYPKFLSDLSAEIETGVPIARTRVRVQLMLAYIEESQLINRYKFLNAQDQKQDSLVGSYWCLYSYEHYYDRSSLEKRILLTRDTVMLNNFGYAVLINARTFEGENIGQLQYTGQYRIKSDRYLILDMLADETGDKELRAIIDIGAGTSRIGDVYTGYFLNASNKLYFGPLLFEKINKVEEITSRVYKEYDASIDKIIWNYFIGLESVPDEIRPSFGTKGRINKFLDL